MKPLSPAEAGPEQRAIQQDLRSSLEVAMGAVSAVFARIRS
ncbi:MAG: hypothetical protein ABUT39_11505 [Acidobacteriota bacterium]